jgi:hypothetical protein
MCCGGFFRHQNTIANGEKFDMGTCLLNYLKYIEFNSDVALTAVI